jgi:hypothetical protein
MARIRSCVILQESLPKAKFLVKNLSAIIIIIIIIIIESNILVLNQIV